jgi:hypothetical protein
MIAIIITILLQIWQPVTGCLGVDADNPWRDVYGVDIWNADEYRFEWGEIVSGYAFPLGDGYMVLAVDAEGYTYALPFRDLEWRCDSEGEHCGHHPCGAYRIITTPDE